MQKTILVQNTSNTEYKSARSKALLSRHQDNIWCIRKRHLLAHAPYLFGPKLDLSAMWSGAEWSLDVPVITTSEAAHPVVQVRPKRGTDGATESRIAARIGFVSVCAGAIEVDRGHLMFGKRREVIRASEFSANDPLVISQGASKHAEQ